MSSAHMSASVSADHRQAIAADLARQGWAVCTDFLPAALIKALRADIDAGGEHGMLRPAAIGRGGTQQVRSEVRGDHIAWLDGASASQQDFLHEMEALRLALNTSLFLGLFEYEGHFALYPPGAFYRRHLDQHQDNDSRLMSCVAYLNADWQPSHGGELRLFVEEDGQERGVDIAPLAGTLVCFLSGMMYHEVLETQAPRYSVTGWFRRREF